MAIALIWHRRLVYLISVRDPGKNCIFTALLFKLRKIINLAQESSFKENMRDRLLSMWNLVSKSRVWIAGELRAKEPRCAAVWICSRNPRREITGTGGIVRHFSIYKQAKLRSVMDSMTGRRDCCVLTQLGLRFKPPCRNVHYNTPHQPSFIRLPSLSLSLDLSRHPRVTSLCSALISNDCHRDCIRQKSPLSDHYYRNCGN